MSDMKVFKRARYDGRSKKRQWEERRSDKGEQFVDDPKKLKANDDSIQQTIEKALLNVGLINEECFNQVQNMQFQRAARTDKGVSAARQSVSLKLGENIDLAKINSELPEVIRVFGYKRVTKRI
ncbi:hypothetical protein NQ318_001483 [Aromia moschata]|uniref:Uncharacterized protein n=1 Tax=Aromia moschata TaxID=1265417 RepID=A0AAV8XCK6_9CUCU|nr:hypothetical protein NQ318_001483 [Aromia moschata]